MRGSVPGLVMGIIAMAVWGSAEAQEARAVANAPAIQETGEPKPPVEPISAPDPLTPAQPDEGPARAPGAPAPGSPEVVAGPQTVDGLVVAARALLGTANLSLGTPHAADLAAVKAYYDDARAKPIWIEKQSIAARAAQAIQALERAESFGLGGAALTPPPRPADGASPAALAEFEVRMSLAALAYGRQARGGRINPQAISQMIDLKPRLYEPRSLLDALAGSVEADVYLEGLNPRHAGFKNLRTALAIARSGDKASVDRILVNMERWRWLPDDLGALHVVNNVPEQMTRVFKNGEVVLQEKIVVGKPNTPTPQFSADMRFVIFHPSWGVPEGIKKNELLPALKRYSPSSSSAMGWLFGDAPAGGASRVLKRHDLRVMHRGREINPDTINWSSVDIRQFQFTQPPSGRNVLGVVKFRFPNRHDVYMHDTSERHLFSNSRRTFSHGCMRVQNPLRLAEVLLANDKGWGGDRIRSLVSRGGTSDITLDTPVPVHNVYFTAAADTEGKLSSFGDIYGLDSRIASALTGRSVAVASVGSGEPDKARRTNRNPQRKDAKQAQAVPSKSSGGFNPFAGFSGN